LEEFNQHDLEVELWNNQQPEVVLQQCINLLHNVLPLGLNNCVMLPQMPAVAVAPYQAYLVTGSVNHPPFVANCSAEDYYQQMIMSHIERQEKEELK
jgi:hypothetical protein